MMLRHIEKQVSKHTTGDGEILPVGGSDSDSESSNSDSTASHSSDENDSSSKDGRSRQRIVPPSLLRVLDDPLRALDQLLGRNTDDVDSDHEESEDASNSEVDSVSDETTVKGCIICPGKQLKTADLASEHLKSKVSLYWFSSRHSSQVDVDSCVNLTQAHLRRLKRYREFIHDPPPHTLLSPDPSDVIDLLDTLIGPPPVLPSGTKPNSTKGKRKKREKRRERRLTAPKDDSNVQVPKSKANTFRKPKASAQSIISEPSAIVSTSVSKDHRQSKAKRPRKLQE